MKNKIVLTAVIFTVGFVTLPIVWGDSDFHWREVDEYKHHLNDVKVTSNPMYQEECGSCHMAYPPDLLPARSWDKLMHTLDNHFGDDAELDEQTHRSITEFLLVNSADKSDYRRSKKFSQSIPYDNAPTRITETPYFKRKHHELPDRLVAGNPKVASFAQCDACHLNAAQGSFNEHDVRIPGYRGWDD